MPYIPRYGKHSAMYLKHIRQAYKYPLSYTNILPYSHAHINTKFSQYEKRMIIHTYVSTKFSKHGMER